LSKLMDRDNALYVAENMFYFDNTPWNYVAVENNDGMIIAEWEI
jgi:hypothetical protein